MSKNVTIIEDVYNKDEEFLYIKTYLFIKGFAIGRNLTYVLRALPLVRTVHNGQYRKNKVVVGDKEYRIPYVLHVLKVASTLISLNLPISNEELDILISAALLHDTIEDAPEGFFKNNGYELVTEYGFSKEIYDIVKLLSKRHGATFEELNIYFDEIKKNKYALLIKMSDRSHNVEDLYTKSVDKLHKYVEETRDFVYPLSTYGKINYPTLSNGITILKSKIVSLTEATEVLVNMYTKELEKKDMKIKELEAKLANKDV